ncbi:isoleucine--tRNA ligase [Turicibacter sanguinis]|jgi:isoleucine--tRNA ligase|uniref:isoleucine--tRNA ligase n=1 Tax=Turicibacter sanguinis TaxID=154288 RepID=UPI0012BA00DD|nr:isoleucine--tRNA ligase [Turicibacter sanguinis]MDB8556715.1 isoleucine--tRNA ligase [Turicibacter sanguinis]MDB8559508.1 isoleucine--tRNA ligase [Turicibacter sanguinis]MDB8562280.1 isoleucine--tRNA ligase [Turicibacter sanguinis]MTH07194.1 isoleucine--tRNA ligase [Turicibacter sanguinis]MTH10766.1 isoleucine--tRNA ligase [Turicibacter sanguinis]
MELKETLLMPKTDFPMRGNLPNREPQIEQSWYDEKLYEKVLEKNQDKTPFVLHDGPPYANGNIHMGHALNKILKDFVVRFKNMDGYYAPYIPGWDTHGLPIEQALTNNKKVNRKEKTVAEFRELCKEYALEQVEGQKTQFKRLGVLGDWDNPYITLQKEYEAQQILVFGKMVKEGLIYKGLKPIYWSPSSETALAEAEIEYHDKKSPSIYVAFKVQDGKGILAGDEEFVIWTTTPWTIPANLGICVNADLEYVTVAVNDRKFIVAKELVESLSKELNWETYEILATYKGSDFEYMTAKHPLFDRESLLILGDHVTLDAGTGLVHTAPGHGEDDFNAGRKYNLEVLCPVDYRGYMTKDAFEFEGMYYEDANKAVGQKLEEKGALLGLKFITHSYPHDWRTKKPIIFRATEQWFASIEALKGQMMEQIKEVNWLPAWGEVRLGNMIKDRADWCISRQRVWGVPIPVFYAEDGEAILDESVINHVANLFREKGSNIWFELEAEELLPAGFTHPGSPNGKFRKETDIMDVWFDSGSSHHSVLVERGLPYPADLYLEGSDQYRGWFNSSLSTGVAMTGRAPYKTVVSHGFVLDGQGRKMSKSIGNVIDPLKLIKIYGADIVRLWVASVDYQADVRISEDLIKQVAESYRKMRNTFRFLLGNLFDFNPKTDLVAYEDLNEVDQFMMIRLNELTKELKSAYEEYRFDDVFKTVNNYISNDLSAFYLDFTKDILYIEKADSQARRSIQTVLYHHVYDMCRLLAPVIPHTADEVYSYIPGHTEISVYLTDMPVVKEYANAAEVTTKWSQFLSLRHDVLKALEEARNQKVIGKSLTASLHLYPNAETKALLNSLQADLKQIFIVSECVLEEGEAPEDALQFDGLAVVVKAAEGHTCDRCWLVVPAANEQGICPRCAEVIEA